MSKRDYESSTLVDQPSIQAYFQKKPRNDGAISISTTAQTQHEEILFPSIQDPATFPNPIPKSTTGHSIQKSWFEDYVWLQLVDDKKSLYCGSYYWAFQNYYN